MLDSSPGKLVSQDCEAWSIMYPMTERGANKRKWTSARRLIIADIFAHSSARVSQILRVS